MNPRKNIPQGRGPQQKPHENLSRAHKPGIVQRKAAASQTRQPPVAPPAYRPQPVPKVLQAKMAAPAAYRPQPLTRVLQPKKAAGQQPHTGELRRQPVAPPVYRPQSKKIAQPKTSASTARANMLQKAQPLSRTHPTPKVLQAKIKTGAHTPKTSSSGKAVAPAVMSGRSSVVQRMDSGYTVKSVSKTQATTSAAEFRSNIGEHLVIKDMGDKLNAYINDEYVGYVSYEEETEEGQRRMRFGYINITKLSARKKKLSGALLFVLSLKALERGIDTMCVGHPDPELKGYWEAMGFDYRAGQAKQRDRFISSGLYKEEDIPAVEEIKPTEATAPVMSISQWSQRSFKQYWT